jgi:hypothetical protein
MTKEERKLYMQEYRKTEKGKLSKKESDKKYYQQNKTQQKVRSQKWKEKNLEKFYKCTKEWNKNNPDKVIQSQKKYRENNPHYKIRNLFHNLKKQNYQNITKPQFKEIKEYIEKQFIGNMNWSNIEIDHKIPLSWFLKETPNNLINDLRNLHPLFKEDNRKKAASYCNSISLDYFYDIKDYIKEERIKQILEVISL